MVSSVSNAATGSSALVSSRVSTRVSLSPRSPPTCSSSSSATTLTKRHLAEDRVQVVERDAHLAGDLGLGRRALQLGLERGVGLLDLAGLVAHRARDPVDRPQLVDDRAADPADRVGLELDRALEVELLDRVDQPEDAVGDEVGLLDVGRQADADPAGDVLHQRRVVQDQPLAQPLVAGRLELAPQLAQRGRCRRRPGRARPRLGGVAVSSAVGSASALARAGPAAVLVRGSCHDACSRLAASPTPAASGSGVRLLIRCPQPLDADMRVDLGRRERSVTEQLLDAPEVRAALEQVRGGRVPQPVRAQVGGPGHVPQQPVDERCGQPVGPAGRRGRRAAAPARWPA